MAKYKQNEFAIKCGMSRTAIPQYVKLKKIIIEGGFIDDSNPINAFFIQKHAEKNLSKKSNKTEENTGVNFEYSENSTIKEDHKPNKKGAKNGDLSYHELEKIKKALDIDKTKQEIELLEKRNAKMDGENIPTDVVKNIFAFYGKALTSNFHNVSENWLTKIAKIKGLSNSEIAEMRGDLAKGINEAVLKAQAEAKKSISNIIKENSLKKEVGEHS